MKKIAISKVKKELEKYNADDSVKELILNNITLYNDIVSDYNNDGKHQAYLLYQLNMQVVKQLESLRKLYDKTNTAAGEPDQFTTFINNLKAGDKEVR